MQRYSLLVANRRQVLLLLIGSIFVVGGMIFYVFSKTKTSNNSVEIVEGTSAGSVGENGNEVVVEVSGAVSKPGVYKLPDGSRIEDALKMAGGITEDANTDWMEKVLNRASKISDGQKIYIPNQSMDGSATNLGVSSETGGSVVGASLDVVNINTASQKELEALSGIGPVTAQNIIDQRPYSSVEELKTKKILNSSVYEKNKDKLTIY